MSLSGNNPRYTYGVIRNLQLHKVLMRDWTVRVYVQKHNNSSKTDRNVPNLVMNKIQQLGAKVVYINDNMASMDPALWRYQVILDQSINYFIVHDANKRLDENLEKITNSWISANTSSLLGYCHNNKTAPGNPVILELFGARRDVIQATLLDTFNKFLATTTATPPDAASSERRFVTDVILPLLTANNPGVCDSSANNTANQNSTVQTLKYTAARYDQNELVLV